jgi:hypothetical protein
MNECPHIHSFYMKEGSKEDMDKKGIPCGMMM